MSKIKAVAAPNLILASDSYSKTREDQLNNELRLYFNRLNTYLNTLQDSSGGSGLSNPHIAAEYSADQFAGGDNTPTLVLWDSAPSIQGFTLNPDGTATAQEDGIYKIDYSLQFANTENVSLDAQVWLQVDNEDVTGSSSIFTLNARKSSGVYDYVVGYSSVVFSCTAGQSFGLWWAVEQAYESGVQDGVYMYHRDAITSPYTAPSNPSAIGSITFVSRT
jgi:hypothetical protein